MHLFEPLGHLLETLAQALFQRCVQFFVDRRAHLLELLFVAALQCGQALFHRGAHFGQRPLVGQRHGAQLFIRRFTETLLRQCGRLGMAAQRGILRVASRQALLRKRRGRRLQRGGDGLLHRAELGAERVDLVVLGARHVALLVQQGLLKDTQGRAQLLAGRLGAAAHFIAQFALEPLAGFAVGTAQFVANGLACVAAQGQPYQEDEVDHREGQWGPENNVHQIIVAARLRASPDRPDQAGSVGLTPPGEPPDAPRRCGCATAPRHVPQIRDRSG